METSRLETRWTHGDTLKAYNPYREMFREASADVVRKVLEQYVGKQDKVIEIGSGLGELVKLVPEYENQIQQTDQSPKIAMGNKTLNKDSNVMIANVYNLPFKNEAFDATVGYSVFDTLSDLEKALKEVRGVLTPNGEFIHFLDLIACGNTFFHKYGSQGVLLPLFEKDEIDGLMNATGLQLVKRSDLQKVKKSLVPRMEGYFDFYCKNPELMYVTGANNPEYRKILRMMSDFVKESGVEAKSVRFNEEFKRDLERSLERSGFELVESGKRDGIAIVERNGRHEKYPQFNVFHNDVGRERNRCEYLPLGLEDKVKVISTQYVTVARKV